ncbi:MAG: L,D-transpeptidase [Anaerolineales bacterium]|nr:L,D-transpeptidase [Anaerolineales bacterium]
MGTVLNRRDFLKLSANWCSAIALTSLGLPTFPTPTPNATIPQADGDYAAIGLGRITAEKIRIYAAPDFAADHLGSLARDQVVWLFSTPGAPAWYLVGAGGGLTGYIHTAYVQRVEGSHTNTLIENIPPGGILGEVSVPFTPTFRYTRQEGWQPLYRLYYQSLHWITALEQSPDGEPCYRLHDHYIEADYHASARHIRPIFPNEYSPIHPEVPPDEKRIQVSISQQTLTAFEGSHVVLHCPISSGVEQRSPLKEGQISTETPIGSFRIQTKLPSRHMGNGELTSDLLAYELPGVPWTMVFHETGVALHSAFWHNNFGVRMSHGCVNLHYREARWLFRWSNPIYTGADYYVREAGTRVVVLE